MVDTPDDLSLLTPHNRPFIRQFQAFADTSAATSFGARLGAQILADRPGAWLETVRALIMHSAEWTPLMQAQLDAARTELQRMAAFRRFGYGVPDIRRAMRSSLNDATVVSENLLRPLRLEGSTVKTQDMHLYTLPWPQEQLEALTDRTISMRVTLSDFIEPSPGERGWKGTLPLCFARSALLIEAELGKPSGIPRTDQQGRDKRRRSYRNGDDGGARGWTLGRIRDVGSLHSDVWVGSAAELSRRNALAVFPIAGWWREKPQLQRYDRDVRYAICITLRAVEAEDIYTPIAAALDLPLQVVLEL